MSCLFAGALAALLPTPALLAQGPSVIPAEVEQPSGRSAAEAQGALDHAIQAIRIPPHVTQQLDYTMTARVRLLLFWVAANDVGGGYIRRGAAGNDPSSEIFQVVMGSDPAKAPHAINRWGAAWELFHKAPKGSAEAESSTFFGFMKVSKGTSYSAMQKELDQEKEGGGFLFSSIINQAGRDESVAKMVPFTSNRDFTIHELDQTEPVIFDRMEKQEGRLRNVSPLQVQACGRSEGFLSSVSELVNAALEERKTPIPVCFFYNGERFNLKLSQVTQVPREEVKLTLHGESQPYVRTYSDLLLAHFDNYNETTHTPSSFELLLGREGSLRGVPLRITYQPNWWFQVVLDLKTPEVVASSETH